MTDRYVVRITSTPDLTLIAERISLIVDDILHNLRSAVSLESGHENLR